jgi:hypothetical protein
MNLASDSATCKMVYVLLIVVAAGNVAGRIAAASRVYEPELTRDEKDPKDKKSRWPAKRPTPMPTFSSNDRSRWATIRALVDEGTFVIGRRDKTRVLPSAVSLLAASDPLQGATLAFVGNQVRISGDSGIIFDDGWQSVDKILNPTTYEYYSTKPPLLSVLVAGLYWLVKTLLGWTLSTDPFAVVRTILILVNLVPFIIYLALLARLIDRFAATDWGRCFVFTAACFATLMTPFLITLNNHTVATCSVVFALYPVVDILAPPWVRTSPPSEPSFMSFAMSGLFASFAVCNELPALAFLAALSGLLLFQRPRQTLLFFLPAAVIPIAALLATNYVAMGEINPTYSKFGGPWYEYEGSHWQKPPPGQVKHGIDWAGMHESRSAYAFHVLLGHHGLFSLSPIWLLAVAGMIWALFRARPTPGPATKAPASWIALALMTLVLTLVVVGFYLVQSDNYGGNTTGLRWLMWLSPLWLLTMLPIADMVGRRRVGRWVAYTLLAWSVFSVSYPAWNPWRQPWLYNLLESGGYIAY